MVLELFAQVVRTALDAAMAEKRQELVAFVERLWGKHREGMFALKADRAGAESRLATALVLLGYAND